MSLIHNPFNAINFRRSNFSGSAWASWDESSEAGLASSDIFVALFKGALGTNETGQGGGLAGVDLILTQINNVAGEAGGYRQLIAASHQYFTGSTGLPGALLKDQDEFTIIIKIKDWGNIATANVPLIRINLGQCDITAGAASVIRAQYKTSDVSSVNTVDTTGVYWFCIWRKGGIVKTAFKKTVRPTAEADFAAGDTCESTNDTVFDAGLTSINFFGDGARWLNIYAAYVVVAKIALFT